MDAKTQLRTTMPSIAMLLLLAMPIGIASRRAVGDETEKPESTVAYWVTQLSNEHYLRREIAEQKLIQAGANAVEELGSVIMDGDLETIERASSALTQIAIDHHPSMDGGAWEKLSYLSTSTTGLVCASTRRATDEVRKQRSDRALNELALAGVFVGEGDFMIRAISDRKLIVQIDENWNQDIVALDWLRWLDQIETARVVGPAITEQVLRRVAQMPELQSLAMVDGTLDDGGLDPLMKAKTIRSLELRYVKLSKDQATRLAAIPVRDSIGLMGTGLSKQDADALQSAVPGVEVVHKNGGFLGVKCLDRSAECEISDVVADSAAEAGGLIRGDVIVQVGDAVVEQFSDLQAEINEHFAGDEIEVKYRRGSKVDKATVTLRRYLDR
jgi:hypothetical protein